MNVKLSLVKTTALAFGAALLMVGVVLSLIGVPPAAQAAPAATIQSMIDAVPDGGTVSIPSGTYTESLTVNKTLTLTGVSSGTTIIQAVTGQRVITVTSGHDLRLENLTVTGGQAPGQGGGGIVIISGSLTLANCHIVNNSANYGGGVYQAGDVGRVDVINSRIELNTSSNHGGGLFVGGSTALTNAQVLSNTASWHGGGLHVQNGRADLIGGVFSNNRAVNGNGGAVNLNGSISLSGVTIISNTANNGGGLQQWNAAPSVLITNTRFERNVARGVGGGAAVSGTLLISHSTFATNTVDSGNGNSTYGGGLYAGAASWIFASAFTGNSALCLNGGSCSHADGGGLYDSGSHVDLTNVIFQSNQAGRMGGGMSSEFSSPVLFNVIFRGNRAGWGGGLNHSIGSPKLTNVLFSGNQAGWAGGMLATQDNPILKHVTFSGNDGYNQGGALLNYYGAPTLINSILWGNTAMNGPEIYNAAPTPTLTVTYSNIKFTGVYTGVGNINADPRFIAPITATVAPTTTGNYNLGAGSPAINAGTNVGVATDIDGEMRDGAPDMGADEYRTCWARLNSSPTDYGHVQAAVDASTRPTDTVKVAGYCPGVQARAGVTQTVYISKSLTVRGGYTTTNWTTSDPTANTTTLDALGRGRVAYVMGSTSDSVVLENLIIRGGYTSGSGGGVFVHTGTATLSGGQILSNTAYTGGGVYVGAGSVVTASGVQISRNMAWGGGGIYAWTGGTAIVNGSQIFSNTATNGDGGGIFVFFGGAATVSGTSILSGTSAAGSGGITNAGILTVTNSMVSGNAGPYGGIENVQTLTLIDSTLSGNQVMDSSYGGGAINQHQVVSAPSATILNCTIVSNTAAPASRSGIWLESGTLNIGNSIVAHNGVTNNVQIDGGAFTSLGYNLTNSGAGTPFTATGDLTNTNPLLGPLQDNGGASWTHALFPRSPAIDRIPFGVNGCGTTIATDQRGQPRPGTFTRLCDIGAYEAQGIHYQIYLPVVIK